MIRSFLILAAVVLMLPGCAAMRRDRCYLAETRYLEMKFIFEELGSYQRTAQAMKDDQWSTCEINTFRLRLRKDLDLRGEEYDFLFEELEPARSTLDFNPGTTEGAVGARE